MAGTTDQTNIAQAIQDVSEKAQILVHEEIELAKAEITEKVTKIARGAVIAGAASFFVVGALLMILHGLAWLAWTLLSSDSGNIFWGYLVVAGVLLILAGLAGGLAARAFRAGSPPAPTMAIDEAKLIRETVQSPHPEQTI